MPPVQTLHPLTRWVSVREQLLRRAASVSAQAAAMLVVGPKKWPRGRGVTLTRTLGKHLSSILGRWATRRTQVRSGPTFQQVESLHLTVLGGDNLCDGASSFFSVASGSAFQSRPACSAAGIQMRLLVLSLTNLADDSQAGGEHNLSESATHTEDDSSDADSGRKSRGSSRPVSETASILVVPRQHICF
jgi:hypothetical protein